MTIPVRKRRITIVAIATAREKKTREVTNQSKKIKLILPI